MAFVFRMLPRIVLPGLMLALSPPAGGAPAARSDAYPLECAYAPRGEELAPQGPCARMVDDAPRIDPAHLRRATFDRGIAEIRIGTVGIAYVRRDGRAATVFILDNGGDAFSQGLVRGSRRGRLVYYDRALRPRLVTAFDWGEPFRDGRAAVCVGCRRQAADAEHDFMVGGHWGVIDRRGRLVAPLAPR